jgi:hypothetical protein
MAGRSVAVLMAWTLVPRIGSPFKVWMFDLVFQCYVTCLNNKLREPPVCGAEKVFSRIVKSQRKKNYFAMAMKNTDKLYKIFHL